MKKTARKKLEGLNIEVICKTEEEHLTMLILVVYCQHFYRRFKFAKTPATIFDIVAEARKAYNEKQLNMPKLDRSEIVWG